MKIEVDSIDESVVTLDAYNSDLNLIINASKCGAEPLTKEGFAFMWAGARASHGAEKGLFCFEVKVIEHLDVSHLPADEPNPHVVRVGFSVDSTTLQLGEDPLSYGYGGTGKISTNCQFKDFGTSFMAGDCVLAVANMDSDLVQIGFAKNGSFIGWAYKVKKSELQGKALFPHVLSKNCSFEVNFGQMNEPYFKLPDAVRNYTFIGCLPMDLRISGSRPPETRESCEMIMMCGLPGAGKSVWAADYSLKHQEKKYNILGTNNIIDKMKVMGLPRKRNYAGRWDVLIQMATKCLNSMFAIGSKLRRNYILDQTNVYPTAQRRKMRNFDGFKRIAVVVVPTEAEYKRRCDKRDREEGKEVPDSAVLEMKANFKLPEKGDVFDEVIFTELQQDEAEKLVKQYNEEGKASLGPARKQFRPNEPMRDNKGFDNRRGNFGGRGDYGNYSNQNMQGSNSYVGNRGNFNSRGGFSRGRGGNDSFGRNNRGSFDSSRSGREGFDRNFNSCDNNRDRGGFDDNRSGRGSYDSFRGNDGGRGGRGSFDSRGRGRGGYESDRGGRGGYDDMQSSRGGYDGAHGVGRGGYDARGGGRGGYNGARGGGRGGYDGARGGGRGGYDGPYGSGRGGYVSSRGGGRNNYDYQDSYGSKREMYGGYGDAGKDVGASSYDSDRGYNKSSSLDQGRDSYKRDYSTMENIPGSTRSTYAYSDYGSDSYSSTKRFDRGYDSSSSDYSRGSSNRFQSSDSGTARGSMQTSDVYPKDSGYSSGYNTDSSSGMQSSYSRDYSYGDYKSPESTDTYTSRGVSSSFAASSLGGKSSSDSAQRYVGSSVSSGSKYSQNTGYSTSGTRATRWSAETPQIAGSVDTYAGNRPQSYTYQKSDPSAVSYQASQTYDYQQEMTSSTVAQQWMTSSTSASMNPSGYGSQAQWMQQYGQQATNQYYSQ